MRPDEVFEQVIPYSPVSKTADGGSVESVVETAPGQGDVLRRLPSGGGVYLLTDEQDRTVLLSAAGDLRRALRIRLAEPATAEDDTSAGAVSRRANLAAVVRKIWWQPAHSQFELYYRFWRVARQLMPRTYLEQLGFAASWFVHVDAGATFPRFAVGKVLRGRRGVDLGPFATMGDAQRFVQLLEDGFDLCRYGHVLEQAPAGQRCAYFDMGRCAAPCDGSVPMSAYQHQVARAVGFALGERESVWSDLDSRMRVAAGRQEFERAAALKQRLERLRGVEHRSFRLAGPMERFNYLVVQRGPGRVRVMPFFVVRGRIEPGEVVRLSEVPDAVEAWLSRLRADLETKEEDDLPSSGDALTELSEQVWLVNHFLWRKDPPGLFLKADEEVSATGLAEAIARRFQRVASEEASSP